MDFVQMLSVLCENRQGETIMFAKGSHDVTTEFPLPARSKTRIKPGNSNLKNQKRKNKEEECTRKKKEKERKGKGKKKKENERKGKKKKEKETKEKKGKEKERKGKRGNERKRKGKKEQKRRGEERLFTNATSLAGPTCIPVPYYKETESVTLVQQSLTHCLSVSFCKG